MLKAIIIILLIALIISLASGLIFFVKDQGTTRRTVNSLGVRLLIAVLLMGVVIYGLYTGKLRSKAPWDARVNATPPAQQSE
ncbi:MAG: DUF2909 domain-containing protein [Pseudomonadales bacterium]